MEDKRVELSKILTTAGETHHTVYAIVDGDHDDWASWYADWLLELSEMPKILGSKPVRSHVVHALVQAERDFAAVKMPLTWQEFYADALLKAFGK
jgi:hypothetical protein